MLGVSVGLGFDIAANGNALTSIFQVGTPTILSKITVGMFSFAMLLPGSYNFINLM
jgi:hypothetical protein